MFQVNGKFDNAAYQQLLRNNNMSADAYAEYLREGLRLTQLQEGLNETEFLLPAQQDEFVKNLFQQRKVRMATLPLAAEVAKQSVSEQEIQDYYNANKAKFLMPETVKVQYLDLTGENVIKLNLFHKGNNIWLIFNLMLKRMLWMHIRLYKMEQILRI